MQMARWFGYRSGYELLQRVWMPSDIQKKFELLEEIDEQLKDVFEDYMSKGRSPASFGPKVMSSAKIAKFLLTSKNKSQNAEDVEFDFSGDSYETTDFMDEHQKLEGNIATTEAFLKGLGVPTLSETTDSAYVWRNIAVSDIKDNFLNADKYKIFECSSLHSDIPIFLDWLKEMNSEGKYLKWNVAVAGDKKADSRWKINGADVGKITRSKKKKKDSPGYIDIGSLRSGRDVLCDVEKSKLAPDKKYIFDSAMQSGKQLISARGAIGMDDIPLLLLYRIDKDRGNESKLRDKIGSTADIIGFSVIIPGDSIGSSHVKAVRVRMPAK